MLMWQHGKQGRDGNGYGISSQDQSGRSAQSQSFGGDRHATACLRADEPSGSCQGDRADQGDDVVAGVAADRCGRVKEGEPQNSASYGRPSTPLMLGDGKVCGVGMQVNTDGYGCMALDINHDILRHEWVDADMSGVEPDAYSASLTPWSRRWLRIWNRNDASSRASRVRCRAWSPPTRGCSWPAISVGRMSI